MTRYICSLFILYSITYWTGECKEKYLSNTLQSLLSYLEKKDNELIHEEENNIYDEQQFSDYFKLLEKHELNSDIFSTNHIPIQNRDQQLSPLTKFLIYFDLKYNNRKNSKKRYNNNNNNNLIQNRLSSNLKQLQNINQQTKLLLHLFLSHPETLQNNKILKHIYNDLEKFNAKKNMKNKLKRDKSYNKKKINSLIQNKKSNKYTLILYNDNNSTNKKISFKNNSTLIKLKHKHKYNTIKKLINFITIGSKNQHKENIINLINVIKDYNKKKMNKNELIDAIYKVYFSKTSKSENFKKLYKTMQSFSIHKDYRKLPTLSVVKKMETIKSLKNNLYTLYSKESNNETVQKSSNIEQCSNRTMSIRNCKLCYSDENCNKSEKCCNFGDKQCCITEERSDLKDITVPTENNCPKFQSPIETCKSCYSNANCSTKQICCKVIDKFCCFSSITYSKTQSLENFPVKEKIDRFCPNIQTTLATCKACYSNMDCTENQHCCNVNNTKCCFSNLPQKVIDKHKTYTPCPQDSSSLNCYKCQFHLKCKKYKYICCDKNLNHCCYKRHLKIKHLTTTSFNMDQFTKSHENDISLSSKLENVKSTIAIEFNNLYTKAQFDNVTSVAPFETSTTSNIIVTSKKRQPKTKKTHKPSTLPSVIIPERKGSFISGKKCPIFPVATQWCQNCSTDLDCADHHKCCEIVEQHCCTFIIDDKPIMTENAISDYSVVTSSNAQTNVEKHCPIETHHVRKCKNCNSDDDCWSGQKCCNTSLNKTCCRIVTIVPQTTSTIAYSTNECPIIKMHVSRCKVCHNSSECENNQLCCKAFDQSCCYNKQPRKTLNIEEVESFTETTLETTNLEINKQEICNQPYTGYCYRCYKDSDCAIGTVCCPNFGHPCCFKSNM